ncbi:MAG: multiheme c-type cytochrome [Kiritimatiellae bacterium]|nr:multiheme c-type cytochrome [Kiritimatiellia bacterium]
MKEMSENRRERAWYILPLALMTVFLVCSFLGGVGYFEFTPAEKTCVSCHEMNGSYMSWTNSAHRNVSCKDCHGGSADSWHALKENTKRIFYHLADQRHDEIRLTEEQNLRVMNNCQSCHAKEFAHWQSGGHGINYAGIFLDEKHNQAEQMAEDCLRCHAMFNENRIKDIVTPLNITGPWQLVNPAMALQPTIPCQACHNLHAQGSPYQRSREPAQTTDVGATNAPSLRRDVLAFYVRQEKCALPIDGLSIPRIVDGERLVTVSSDPRQRLCMQCHAPNSHGHAGSCDDRTPIGVHEGISCAACHKPHSNDTRGSCVTCHPRFTSCNQDVMAMDTTYRSRTSQHNIHRLQCADCHTTGVPPRPASVPVGIQRVL